MKTTWRRSTFVALFVAVVSAGLAGQSAAILNPLDSALKAAFAARNPRVTQTKVLEVRALGMAANGYVLLGWGIRPDMRFEGSFDDELFGLFVVNNGLTRIERTLDIFPTCRWADCIVSIERVSWSTSEVVVIGAGSYGDQPFRKTYKVGPIRSQQ